MSEVTSPIYALLFLILYLNKQVGQYLLQIIKICCLLFIHTADLTEQMFERGYFNLAHLLFNFLTML